MGIVNFEISMSLDGFVAGPNQSEENPLGEGGEDLHQWAIDSSVWRKMHGREGGVEGEYDEIYEQAIAATGSTLMGRGMFGGGPGPWGDDPWEGWWGEEPPFHHPVFVLTNHPREPLVKGDTTFTFVTEGIEAALDQAGQAAGDKNVHIGGGANAAQQYLDAGLVDEVELHIAPLLLGDGTRLFENIDARPELELTRTVTAPSVTHLHFRVAK